MFLTTEGVIGSLSLGRHGGRSITVARHIQNSLEDRADEADGIVKPMAL